MRKKVKGMQETLYFEELESEECLAEWWQYALAGVGGAACGVVAYVAIAAAT